MWNLDKKPRSAARLGFWLAPRAEQGEQCRGQHRAPLCPPVIISFRSWAYLIFAPSDLALAHRGLHKEHPRTTESPGCSQTQAVCFHLSLRGQAQSQGVPWEKGVWKSFFFHFFFSFFFFIPTQHLPLYSGFPRTEHGRDQDTPNASREMFLFVCLLWFVFSFYFNTFEDPCPRSLPVVFPKTALKAADKPSGLFVLGFTMKGAAKDNELTAKKKKREREEEG